MGGTAGCAHANYKDAQSTVHGGTFDIKNWLEFSGRPAGGRERARGGPPRSAPFGRPRGEPGGEGARTRRQERPASATGRGDRARCRRLPGVARAVARRHPNAAPHGRGHLDDADWLRHRLHDPGVHRRGRGGRSRARAGYALVALRLQALVTFGRKALEALCGDAFEAPDRLAADTRRGGPPRSGGSDGGRSGTGGGGGGGSGSGGTLLRGGCRRRGHCTRRGLLAGHPPALRATLAHAAAGHRRWWWAVDAVLECLSRQARLPADRHQALHLRPRLPELREEEVALRLKFAVLRLTGGQGLAQLCVLALRFGEPLLRQVSVPLRLAQQLEHHVGVPGSQHHGLRLAALGFAVHHGAALAQHTGVGLGRGRELGGPGARGGRGRECSGGP
mmetsp:Transcript_69378/g.214543  ORF Transcript_69378/g.214543 Transcript_69378/m.214543 type:complete len:391 (-) Transcript_69378:133-1305(-)